VRHPTALLLDDLAARRALISRLYTDYFGARAAALAPRH
jgi:hypothetical protein